MRTVTIDGMPVGDGHPPRVMGVLNMSGESNYGPSVYPDPERAAGHVDAMIEEGADIVDIGLQSANPKNDWFPAQMEMKRLGGAIDVIDAVEGDVAFSIETRYAEVADAALAAGFDMVNDVCGFADPDMPDVCAAHDVPVVKMASPPDVTKPGHLKTVEDSFEALRRGGFTEKTIIDPAFGGWYEDRTDEDNWALFRRLREFRAFGRPILTATNREDFLGEIADRPATVDQLPVSLAAATMEVERGAHVIRTHDVAETADVVKVAHVLGDGPRDDLGPAVTEMTAVTGKEIGRTLSLRERHTSHDETEFDTRAFQIELREESAVAALIDWAADADLLVAGSAETGLFLAGSTAALTRAFERQPPASDALAAVLEPIRRVTHPDGG